MMKINTDKYKYYDFLLSKLVESNDLCKIGGYRDGGYVTSYKAIMESNLLISGGIGSNSRFELDSIDINPKLKVLAFDKSFSIIKMFLRTFYHFFKIKRNFWISLFENFSVLLLISKFKVIKKFITKSFDMTDIINKYGITNDDKIFVKMDIEGSEYEILNSLIKCEHLINGICIEFHDLDKSDNLESLKKYIKETNLNLIFISINESSIDNNFPKILELSFVDKKYLIKEKNYLQSSTDPYNIQTKFF